MFAYSYVYEYVCERCTRNIRKYAKLLKCHWWRRKIQRNRCEMILEKENSHKIGRQLLPIIDILWFANSHDLLMSWFICIYDLTNGTLLNCFFLSFFCCHNSLVRSRQENRNCHADFLVPLWLLNRDSPKWLAASVPVWWHADCCLSNCVAWI